MSIIRNMLTTGVLALLFSVAYVIWAVGFPHKKIGPLAMMVLAVGMLLFGGGLFPPVLAFIMGLVAVRIHAPKKWWADKAPTGLRRFFARAWGWIFALCARRRDAYQAWCVTGSRTGCVPRESVPWRGLYAWSWLRQLRERPVRSPRS
jgi:hypothetical protein